MLLYAAVYIVAIFFAFCSDVIAGTLSLPVRLGFVQRKVSGNTALSWGMFIASGAVLFLFRGLRCGIGVDYFYSYVPKFNTALGGQELWGEALYNAFIELAAAISGDYRVLFILDAAISVIILYAAVALSRSLRCISVAAWCLGYSYIRSFNMQAQYMAIVIAMLGIALFLFSNKRLLGVLIVVFSAGFHLVSAVLIVPPLLVELIDRTKNKSRISLGVSLLLPICTTVLRGYLPLILQAILSGTRFGFYFYTNYNTDEISGYLLLLNSALLLAMYLVILHSKRKLDDVASAALLFQSLALCCSILTGAIPLASRIAYCFMAVHALLFWPFIRTVCVESKTRLVYIVGVTGLLAALQFGYLAPQDTDRVIPYLSVFDSQSTIQSVQEEILNIPGARV
ncbi:EpsG family protein [Thermophilibacter sp.]